ncbi:hypothetical protein L6164_018959 [Bauhinia variegata]|uniref:Uncharacterized protein n=1 Tax=Bauhinia variegata TaxID=167791 RepID=A0ACB9NDN1_BAUVA|nr:hypothetical protein L6164_018959 [Bauhinia variegata]
MISTSGSVSVLANPTSMLSLEKYRTLSQVRQIHAYFIKTNLVNHTLSVGKLISVCTRSGLPGGLEYALLIFLRIQNPTSSFFHALIRDFSKSSNPFQAVVLYSRMLICLEEFWEVEY